MKLEFSLFGRVFRFFASSSGRQEKYVAGITNKCLDGRYVIFLDYDEVPYEWVAEELAYLQFAHKLGTFHVFKTLNGFHAICTDKVGLYTLVRIMRDTSTDAAYLNVPLRRARRVWTLRTSEKGGNVPEWVASLKMGSQTVKSTAHNELLRKLYNLEIPHDLEDGETTFFSGHYHVEA